MIHKSVVGTLIHRSKKPTQDGAIIHIPLNTLRINGGWLLLNTQKPVRLSLTTKIKTKRSAPSCKILAIQQYTSNTLSRCMMRKRHIRRWRRDNICSTWIPYSSQRDTKCTNRIITVKQQLATRLSQQQIMLPTPWWPQLVIEITKKCLTYNKQPATWLTHHQ